MGGRGTLSGTAKYGEEFKTIEGPFQTSRGEVKVIASRLHKNNQRPYLTHTKNRIYATVNNKGVFNNVYFFDDNGRVVEEWNLFGKHGDVTGPHKHRGFEHSEYAEPLMPSDKAFLEEMNRKRTRRP